MKYITPPPPHAHNVIDIIIANNNNCKLFYFISVFIIFLIFALPVSTYAAPGHPEVPQPPVPVFSESFDTASTTAVSIVGYAGVSGMTYTADPVWTPAADQCDGWVMGPSSPAPATDPGCQVGNWPVAQVMAQALGEAQGMTPAEAANNNVLTALTAFLTVNNAGVTPVDYTGTQLKTNAYISAQGGHFYAVGAWFAATTCAQPTPALETFYLLENDSPIVITRNLNPCTGAYSGTAGVNDSDIYVVQMHSSAILLPTDTTTLGFQIDNAQSSGAGNDTAFDSPSIEDVTPQLDKAFSPAAILIGGSSTLTLTITNTTDLREKAGWSFTDTLPAGLTVAATPNVSNTCGGTVTAAAGASSIVLSAGDLPAGTVDLPDGVTPNPDAGTLYCTVTVDVTPAAVGVYTSGPANVTRSLGIQLPAPATLTVTAPFAVPALHDPRLLALLVLLLGGLTWGARRAGWR